MKQKPYQGKAFLRVVLAVSCLTTLAYPFQAFATGTPGTPASSPILSCPVPTPTGETSCVNCCPAPEVLLRLQFRGPGVGAEALDSWYTSDFLDLFKNKFAEIERSIKATLLAETGAIGSFIDAQNNLKSISGLQQAAARNAREQMVGESLCRYATLSQSLAASEANSNDIRLAMTTRSADRQLLKVGVSAGLDKDKSGNEAPVSRGQSADKKARWAQFITTFCSSTDIAFAVDSNAGLCTNTDEKSANRDVDYSATIDSPMTLDIPPDGSLTDDVTSVNALANNLYAHDIANIVPTGQELDPSIEGNANKIQDYMKLRSAIARRSVAENSFTAITAMKAKGTAGSAVYAQNLVKELGLKDEDATLLIGLNPSYYAQMDALTRKLYQSPAFYINLMEGSTNVLRQQAAMKSLELMQQRDMYKSMERSEMLLATLLEIYIERHKGTTDKVTSQSAKQ